MAKNLYVIVLLSSALVLLASAPSYCASSSSDNYTISQGIVDGGGGQSSSANYSVVGKGRSRGIDTPFSAAYRMLSGFLRSVFFGGDTIPPASIGDLDGGGGTNAGEVTLTWTAVGDDGNSGQAAGYIVKYSNTPIRTQTEFDNATTYVQNWVPADAGSTESFTLTGLNPGDYLYFVVIAVDEDGNQSTLSNNVGVVVKVADDAAVELIVAPVHTPQVFDPERDAFVTIEYYLNKDADVQVIVFNIAGKVYWKKMCPSGTEGGHEGLNRVTWDGNSEFYGLAANGVYTYHLLVQQGGSVKSLGKGKIPVYR